MAEEDKVTLPIHEFGGYRYTPMNNSHDAGEDIYYARLNEFAQIELSKDVEKFEKLMSYLTDVYWVKKPEIKLAGQVDMLRHYDSWIWHSLVASQGYAEFADHFKERYQCHETHEQKIITLDYVWGLFKRWWKTDRKHKNDLDD